jgi:Holliday junction resolvase-like predicted endonuclease
MPKQQPRRGSRNQQVGRAGEYFVVAELNKRGAYAVAFAGNMPKIDLMACNEDQSRTIHIQVKTKRSGRSWQSSIVGSGPTKRPKNESVFWVFVDLGDVATSPRYWIAPDWWIRNDIDKAHQAYLGRHGGTRPSNPDSKHHSIDEKRLKDWKERWDVLGIFEAVG